MCKESSRNVNRGLLVPLFEYKSVVYAGSNSIRPNNNIQGAKQSTELMQIGETFEFPPAKWRELVGQFNRIVQ